MKKIGFIGLGIMGKPMAKNLVKAGYRLIVNDVVPGPVQELAQLGAETESSPAAVARKSEVLITMLPNSPHVKEVALGKNGVLEGAAPNMIYIDMSSIAPIVSQEVGKAMAAKKVRMLDAPVSGGEPKAIDGSLSIMVGGDQATFNEVKDLLACLGKSVVLTGPLGSGNVTKLANQIMVAINIIGMSEALVLAKKAGTDPKVVFEAVRGGLAGSTVLDAKAPMVLSRNFNPGFRIELHLKDLLNVMDTSREINAPLPFTSQVVEILKALVIEGKGKQDHSGIIQYFEKMANIEVK
jgi:2-hydroxy-3-oxopropionate reductase